MVPIRIAVIAALFSGCALSHEAEVTTGSKIHRGACEEYCAMMIDECGWLHGTEACLDRCMEDACVVPFAECVTGAECGDLDRIFNADYAPRAPASQRHRYEPAMCGYAEWPEGCPEI